MLLCEACQLMEDFTGVHISSLDTMAQKADFCEKYQFHSFQEHLTPASLESLFFGLEPGEVRGVLDVFHVRLVFFLADAVPMAVGPYCTEFFAREDCEMFLKQLGLPKTLVKDLGVYRGSFPVISEREVSHLIRCLSKNLGLELHISHVHYVDYGHPVAENYRKHAPQKPYAQLVRERYQIEEQFMENIRQGDRISAIQNWRKLHQAVAFFAKETGQTLEAARISVAIFRTTIRIVAMEVGIPSLVNDQISGESAAIIRKATTIDEIDLEHERLIRKYCQVIHEYKTKNYSGLVLSAIYCIEHRYTEDLTVPEIAKELSVSPNYLITCFRKETGATPNAYLCRTRMRKASALLSTSEDPIQEISAQVGILDSNYFARLFKKEYGETPANYRKTHKL